MMWVESPFCITGILQTTSVFASKNNRTQLTKPVIAHETVPTLWKLDVCTWKLVLAMGTYVPKKYERQFYHSCPNPYSGIPVKDNPTDCSIMEMQSVVLQCSPLIEDVVNPVVVLGRNKFLKCWGVPLSSWDKHNSEQRRSVNKVFLSG